jgi:outer membrane murein-binding lipoprotein Lpp
MGPPLNFAAPPSISSEYNCVPQAAAQAAAQAWPQPIYQPQPQPQASQPPCPDCCCQGEWHDYKLIPVDGHGSARSVSWQDAKTIRLKENAQGVPCAVTQGGREFCQPGAATATANRPEISSDLESKVKTFESDMKQVRTDISQLRGDVADAKEQAKRSESKQDEILKGLKKLAEKKGT